MSLRTQAWLCFAAAALALLGFPEALGEKYVIAAIAVFFGVSLWLRDGRRREQRAAALARIAALEAASDDEEDDEAT